MLKQQFLLALWLLYMLLLKFEPRTNITFWVFHNIIYNSTFRTVCRLFFSPSAESLSITLVPCSVSSAVSRLANACVTAVTSFSFRSCVSSSPAGMSPLLDRACERISVFTLLSAAKASCTVCEGKHGGTQYKFKAKRAQCHTLCAMKIVSNKSRWGYLIAMMKIRYVD